MPLLRELHYCWQSAHCTHNQISDCCYSTKETFADKGAFPLLVRLWLNYKWFRYLICVRSVLCHFRIPYSQQCPVPRRPKGVAGAVKATWPELTRQSVLKMSRLKCPHMDHVLPTLPAISKKVSSSDWPLKYSIDLPANRKKQRIGLCSSYCIKSSTKSSWRL